jgi:uncharacterized protein (DUF4213/DUF364 family)
VQIIDTWLQEMQRVLHHESVTISEVRIGVFYTAVQLASGHVGVAFTPRDLHDTVCCPRSAAAAPQAGRLAGQEAWHLAQYALTSVPLRRAVGVAVLNALSALTLERHGVPGGRLLVGKDALDAAGVHAEDRVVLVGAFVPFIKALKNRVASLWVVDKHRQALKPEELHVWRSPQQAPEVLAQASVVIITGSTLVEGGLEALLVAARKARTVVLAGPTASPWPPPFFARGIHVLGGIRVRDGAKILHLVSEGGSGYFFEEAAEKICVVRDA